MTRGCSVQLQPQHPNQSTEDTQQLLACDPGRACEGPPTKRPHKSGPGCRQPGGSLKPIGAAGKAGG